MLIRKTLFELDTRKILRRGFKAEAEKLALKFRVELNLHACAPLCAFKLAEHLSIPIIPATKFVTLPSEIELLSNDCEWSALTMTNFQGKRIIIHNPFNSDARQQSDLMHELAHVICKHESKAANIDVTIPGGLRCYDEVQEEEAKWLGATLLLATPCLLWATKENMSIDEIAFHYTASIDMVRYRINTTGVAKRIKYFKKRT